MTKIVMVMSNDNHKTSEDDRGLLLRGFYRRLTERCLTSPLSQRFNLDLTMMWHSQVGS